MVMNSRFLDVGSMAPATRRLVRGAEPAENVYRRAAGSDTIMLQC